MYYDDNEDENKTVEFYGPLTNDPKTGTLYATLSVVGGVILIILCLYLNQKYQKYKNRNT